MIVKFNLEVQISLCLVVYQSKYTTSRVNTWYPCYSFIYLDRFTVPTASRSPSSVRTYLSWQRHGTGCVIQCRILRPRQKIYIKNNCYTQKYIDRFTVPAVLFGVVHWSSQPMVLAFNLALFTMLLCGKAMQVHYALRDICAANPYILWIPSSSYVMPKLLFRDYFYPLHHQLIVLKIVISYAKSS